MDANTMIQAGQTAQAMKEQISPWLSALAVAGGWAGRELTRFGAAATSRAEWIMGHGGLGRVIGKLIWNSGTPPVAAGSPEAGGVRSWSEK
jgi:hypothetical protein